MSTTWPVVLIVGSAAADGGERTTSTRTWRWRHVVDGLQRRLRDRVMKERWGRSIRWSTSSRWLRVMRSVMPLKLDRGHRCQGTVTTRRSPVVRLVDVERRRCTTSERVRLGTRMTIGVGGTSSSAHRRTGSGEISSGTSHHGVLVHAVRPRVGARVAMRRPTVMRGRRRRGGLVVSEGGVRSMAHDHRWRPVSGSVGRRMHILRTRSRGHRTTIGLNVLE